MNWRAVVFLFGLVLGCERPNSSEGLEKRPAGLSDAQRITLADRAITRLDVSEAAELLLGTHGPAAARAKARLSIYQADCEGALAHLATDAARREGGAGQLLSLADRCHGATAGGRVLNDEKRGIWLRFQDSADELLAPLLIEVIDQARENLGRDLGVQLPRPLRLDLVRDLFSLSAVSGLPLDAAETTGTVAVARWGRVTMLSPRATQRGYPWADTLAHELTHLMLTRATMDRAPLWLQEGIAKREEERWRKPRPFDSTPDPRQVAADAQASGESVGVTQLGPSIAMLPTANAAAIAFAEVSSFMGFWIDKNGPLALPLLLRELAHTKDADSAMRSVSGLSVTDWELLFRRELSQFELSESQALPESPGLNPQELSRQMRLSELLFHGEHFSEAADLAEDGVQQAPHVAALRFYAKRALLRADQGRDPDPLGTLADVRSPHGGWLALRARQLSVGQSSPEGRELLRFAQALDPLLVEVACGGTVDGGNDPLVELSGDDRKLCEHVRRLPLRGSR